MAAHVGSQMLSRVPVIVILGATGSGKSKLAIEIARKYGGEILSADSMQVYKGLDIVTNKVTDEERTQAPHHLIDLVDPLLSFSVVDFRNKALHILEELLAKRKLPLIVGGTNYYIESLLWRVLVAEERDPDDPLVSHQDDDEPDTKKPRTEISSPELHRRLQEVDPEMASQLHPNNRRRIVRSLQVYDQLGRRHSDILREQRQAAGGSELGGPLRYPHSCILWLQCDRAVLDKRLDSRVDDMIKRGLIQELLDFHSKYNEQRLSAKAEADYTTGIFQSIGFKEFHQYLLLPDSERSSPEGQKLFEKGVEDMKQVTRRYARRQRRWVINRFLRRPTRQVPPVFGLDTSDPSKWDEMVYNTAVHIVDCYMKEINPTEVKPMPVEIALNNTLTTYNCDICNRVFIGDIQWQAHLKSKKHQKVVKRKKRAEGAPSNGDAPIKQKEDITNKEKIDVESTDDLKDDDSIIEEKHSDKDKSFNVV